MVLGRRDGRGGWGDGAHPSTALCLEWPERGFKEDESLLDYGCGSGVLAIAARLGCREAVGVDVEYEAPTAARTPKGTDGNDWVHGRSVIPGMDEYAVVANIRISRRFNVTCTPSTRRLCTRLTG